MDPYVGCHAFHFFGGLLLFLLGVVAGRAMLWRRMMRFGPPPWAHGAVWYGGHCGPHYWGYPPTGGGWGPAPGPQAGPAPGSAPAPQGAPPAAAPGTPDRSS